MHMHSERFTLTKLYYNYQGLCDLTTDVINLSSVLWLYQGPHDFLAFFEPTRAIKCTVGSYESPSVCLSICPSARLSVCLWLDKNYWTIIHISRTVWARVTKFGMVMNKVKGHIGKQRQVGSHQRQVASFCISMKQYRYTSLNSF